MIKYLLILFFSLTSLFSTQSCYDYYKVEQKETHETLNTAVFILIDETTVFDENLKNRFGTMLSNLYMQEIIFMLQNFQHLSTTITTRKCLIFLWIFP